MARTRMRVKIPRLVEAFTGHFDDHHRFLLAQMLARIDGIDDDIAVLDAQIEAHLAPFDLAVERLDEIPGIGPVAAAVIIAEIGVDMTRFPTAGHLCSWAKFSPGIKSSAGKNKSNGSTGHGDRYLARVLGEAAPIAGRTDTFLGERYRRIARRRGKKKAIVAVGRSTWSSSGTCSPTPRPASTTSAPTTSPSASTPRPRNATTSDSSKRWAITSPSNPQPDPHHRRSPGSAGSCRLPTHPSFSD